MNRLSYMKYLYHIVYVQTLFNLGWLTIIVMVLKYTEMIPLVVSFILLLCSAALMIGFYATMRAAYLILANPDAANSHKLAIKVKHYPRIRGLYIVDAVALYILLMMLLYYYSPTQNNLVIIVTWATFQLTHMFVTGVRFKKYIKYYIRPRGYCDVTHRKK